MVVDARDQEHPEVLAVLDDAWARYKERRGAHEKQWMVSLLFWAGHQWIKYQSRDTSFTRRTLPAYVPTPVTNKFAETGERLTSVISRVEPNWAMVPGSEQEIDLAAADVAKKLEAPITEENGVPYLRECLARWLTATGNGGLLSGAMPEPERTPALAAGFAGAAVNGGPTGEVAPPLGPPLPRYRLYTDVISPFELFVNLGIPRLEDQPKVLIVQPRDPDWVEMTYGQVVEPDREPQPGLRYLEALGYLGLDRGASEWGGGLGDHPRSYVKRGYVRPSEQFPDGLYVVGAGDKALESGVLPADGDGRRFIPLVWFCFDAFPGAFFGRSPMFDLISKQAQRNRFESLLELHQMRMSAPVWLKPRNTTTSEISGEPGKTIEYDALGPNAAKPERIPGEPLAMASLAMLNKLDADMEALAATFEALKGQAPFSGAPGIVVQQLLEQGLSRFGPTFRNLAEGWRQWMKQQLELFRVYGTTPRMLKAMGDSGRYQVEAFSRADLAGAVDVRIESASTIPRSEQVETQKALAAVEVGLVDVQDPDVRWELLKRLNLRDLMKQTDEQRLQAAKENERLLRGEAVEVEPLLDNDPIHMTSHRRAALSDAAEAVVGTRLVPRLDVTGQPVVDPFTGAPAMDPQPVTGRAMILEHMALHEQNMARQALAAALQQAPPAAAGDQPGGAPPEMAGATEADAGALAPEVRMGPTSGVESAGVGLGA